MCSIINALIIIIIIKKTIRFWHPDYNPDPAQKLISSSMSRHLSTFNISPKSMHAFLSNLAYRQTDRQIEKQTDKRTKAKHIPPPLLEANKTWMYTIRWSVVSTVFGKCFSFFSSSCARAILPSAEVTRHLSTTLGTSICSSSITSDVVFPSLWIQYTGLHEWIHSFAASMVLVQYSFTSHSTYYRSLPRRYNRLYDPTNSVIALKENGQHGQEPTGSAY